MSRCLGGGLARRDLGQAPRAAQAVAPGAAGPAGAGVSPALIAGGSGNASPQSRAPCGPGGGASPQGRGLYANTAGGAGRSACALRARSGTGSYTMHRARQPRGEGGDSHVNEGRLLPRHWRRRGRGGTGYVKQRAGGAHGVGGRRVGAVTPEGRGPHANHAGSGGRGSHANKRAAASRPLPSGLSPPL